MYQIYPKKSHNYYIYHKFQNETNNFLFNFVFQHAFYFELHILHLISNGTIHLLI